MVAVLRVHGLRFVIFVDDHEPAHVHVFGDGEAKINLDGSGGAPELVWMIEFQRADVRRAMRAASDHREALLKEWKRIHG